MKQIIKRVTAVPLKVRASHAQYGFKQTHDSSMCHVEVESADGIVGEGLGYFADSVVLATLIERVAAPAILERDALDSEAAWQALYWTLASSGQSGYAFSAISALDIAIWDLKGKALGLPIWRLLGGYRPDLPAYATLGLTGLPINELITFAKTIVERGFHTVKIRVGRPGLDRRASTVSPETVIRDDIARVKQLRAALGPEIAIAIDGACRLDLHNAVALARGVEQYGIEWYEEPLLQNDTQLLAQLRSRTTIKIAVGQSEAQASRFRELLVKEAVDVVQPNVLVAGGFTQCARISGLAAAFNAPIANGGGAPFHNMHLQAGVPNGLGIEYQTGAVAAATALYEGLPEIAGASFIVPDKPGLGFQARRDALKEYRAR
jgi:L-rhamnonate dehydratase